MGAKFRSWWKQIKTHPITTILVSLSFAIIVLVLIGGYKFNWNWTGFNGNAKSGKTLWDWMQLLIIPLALAVIALVFQLANSRTERQIAKERYEQDQQIALDKQREDLLQIYLDRISELLLEKNLRTSPSEEVRNVARVQTITILTQLDERRIGYVFAFLREAGLMSTTSNDNAVSLSGADLHAVNWSQAGLSRANLSGVKLWEADLSNDDLEDADLSNAELEDADLSGANLTGAKVTGEQLEKAKSLQGATMPDGSLHP